MNQPRVIDEAALLKALSAHAHSLGFSQIGVADVDLTSAEQGLLAWLQAGFHGGMHYMAAHGLKRARPAELVPGTVRVITARMNYLPNQTPQGDWQTIEWQRLKRPEQAVVSLYARGRDYHKVLRQRLKQLASWLEAQVGALGYRVFTDSAPVLEVELASRSGLGWRGKHTLTLNREGGSLFFLGEIYINFPLPVTAPSSAHCGSCQACIDVCPTQAIVAPYKLDARRCISYLTIEHDGPIPLELRPLMGNRIYGCDDCQLICPWNKYATVSSLPDFDARAPLNASTLLELWAWTADDFLRHTEGSAIRRIGFERWQRNVAVALGNALGSTTSSTREQQPRIQKALEAQRESASPMVQEHIAWALGRIGISVISAPP
ncbi:MAG: tRNA epoxyqueuosine(34) reductase QueG [Burkholderiales bacterium]